MLKVFIPQRLTLRWSLDSNDILNIRNRVSGGLIFKFSYHPVSRELLFAEAPMYHDIMIKLYGQYPFAEYVRGIYFKEKRTIYLRGHKREDWLKLTRRMLRERGVPRSIRIIWGEKAANNLAEDLRWL